MKSDLISIVVPIYNAEKYLAETILSIQEQTYTNWELILVDDCSTDGTTEIVNKYIKTDNRIRAIRNKENKGSAFSRNIGITNAQGNFLCFQDADDLWDKNKLELQLKFMKTTGCAFSYTSYKFVNKDGMPTGRKVIAKKEITYKEALRNNIISTITVMFDLTKMDKKLIKMPDLMYVEDTATWWKILRNGYTAYGIDDVFSYYRRTKKSQSSNKVRTLKRLWNLYRKVEKLDLISSSYYFVLKNVHAIWRRII